MEKMVKKLDKTLLVKMVNYMTKKDMDYTQARAFVEYVGITQDTIVMSECFSIIPAMLEKLYNPADYGKFGKLGEVEERLARWQENGRSWCKYRELHARKSGKSDLSKRQEEMKTGAGDWLYSEKYFTREDIINEYRKRKSLIYWKTEFFTIRCSWAELFDYMETYNDKGAIQFFKASVKQNIELSKTIVMLQEWKTSKKKIAFFANCPYNIEKP